MTPKAPPRVLLVMRFALATLVGSALAVAACAEPTVAPVAAAPGLCGPEPIRLAVGEVALPDPAAPTLCSVAGIQDAEYVVAWLDTRAVTAARTGVEPSYEPYAVGLSITEFLLRTGVRSLRAPTAREAIASANGQPTLGDFHAVRASLQDGVLETRPRNRRTAFTLGEEFLLEDQLSGLPRPAIVTRIYDNQVVVVRWANDATDDLDRYLAQLDTAIALVRQHAGPVWRRVYVDEEPRSTQAGQFMILLQREEDVPLRSWWEVSGDTLYTWMDALSYPWISATRLAQTLTHEMTHPYQRMYMRASRSASGLPFGAGAATWAVEGSANLMSYEFLRRVAGLPLDGNRDWRTPATSTAMALFQARTQPAGGVITDGFDNAMGFFRDLMLRRMAAGEPLDDALREVARGAVEGWYGLDGISTRRGLVDRMRARLGASWEPEEALLDWALSHAADDRTTNPRFQDRTSLRVWDLPPGQAYGWFSDGILTPAQPTFFLFKRYGSPAYTTIREANLAFTVEVQAYEVPIRWKLLRVR